MKIGPSAPNVKRNRKGEHSLTPISDPETTSLVQLLSPERLAALKELTGSDEIAIRLHQETLRLGADLMNVVATIEIALRNTVCANLSHHFGVPNWLFQPPVPFQWKQPEQSKIAMALDSARRAEYSKLSQTEKGALDALAYPAGKPEAVSHLKRSRDRRRHINVTDGKVIAELTFYFWKRLYGPDYDQSLWRTSLKRTFPDKSIPRATVAEHLEQIYQARNRLAHHEPVLRKRFEDTMIAIKFVAERLTAASPNNKTALCNLIQTDVTEVRARAMALHTRLDSFRVPH